MIKYRMYARLHMEFLLKLLHVYTTNKCTYIQMYMYMYVHVPTHTCMIYMYSAQCTCRMVQRPTNSLSSHFTCTRKITSTRSQQATKLYVHVHVHVTCMFVHVCTVHLYLHVHVKARGDLGGNAFSNFH